MGELRITKRELDCEHLSRYDLAVRVMGNVKVNVEDVTGMLMLR